MKITLSLHWQTGYCSREWALNFGDVSVIGVNGELYKKLDFWLKGMYWHELAHIGTSWLILAYIGSDFWITAVKSGFSLVRLTLRLTGIGSELTLGQLLTYFIHFFDQKVWQTMENPKWLSEKFALGNSLGSSDFPMGLRPSGKSDDPRKFPRAKFSRQPLQTFHCLYLSWLLVGSLAPAINA